MTGYFTRYAFQNDSYIKILDIVEGMDQGPIEGTLKFVDGSKYEGQLKNYMFDGFGIYYRPDGSKRYEGEFKTGNYHGKGIWYREDGTKWYEGEVVIGLRNGSGIEYAKDGTKLYEGGYKNNCRHGKGT